VVIFQLTKRLLLKVVILQLQSYIIAESGHFPVDEVRLLMKAVISQLTKLEYC